MVCLSLPPQLAKLSTGNAVFSSCSIARLVNRHQEQHVPDVSFLLFCGSHDKHVYCWQGQGESACTRWKTELDSEVYSIPFVSTIPLKDGNSRHGRVSVMLRHSPPLLRSTPPEQLNVFSQAPVQGQERGHTSVSVPVRGQKQAILAYIDEYKDENVVPVQVMSPVHAQSFSDMPEESSPVVSSQELLTVVCVCSSNGIVFVLDALSGRVLGSFKAPWDIYSSPVVVGNSIIVGCRNDSVYKVHMCSER